MPADTSGTHPDYLPLQPLGPAHIGGLPQPASVNQALHDAFLQQVDAAETRKTHHFMGRFENIYIDRQQLPALQPVIDMLLHYSSLILGRETGSLHNGFWFNAMQPGDQTSLHTHEEEHELLSAVYYIQASGDCGNLELNDQGNWMSLTPQAGQIVLFDPAVPHRVGPNKTQQLRLSVAFNLGYRIDG